ncbi:hypothetical protein [Dactylosporangium sp. NPDC051541]|uniref:hypothetical protein n=1 Tax=Dactylosporangium sp. NPDC051541 TaxID=3363977 RepID=UPI003797B639
MTSQSGDRAAHQHLAAGVSESLTAHSDGRAVFHVDGQYAENVRGGMHQYVVNYLNRLGSVRRYEDKLLTHMAQSFADPVFANSEAGLDENRLSIPIGEVATQLRRESCIVLTGEPSTGRHLTALMVLKRLGLPVWRLRATIDREESNGAKLEANIDGLAIPDHCCCVLEVPDQADGLTSDLAHAVSNYQARLPRQRSFLVIVLSGRLLRADGSRPTAPVFWMNAPDSREVFQRHLAASDLPRDVAEDLMTSELADRASRFAAGDAVRLARHTTTVVQATDGLIDTDSIVAQTLAAFHRWEDDLAVWFGSNSGTRERLFLVVTAIFHGSRGDFLQAMACDLAAALEETAFVRGGISEPGVRQLAHMIGADVTKERTIAFKRPGYAEAVIEFLTHDRDEKFQQDLWKWVAEVATRKQFGRSERGLPDQVARFLLDTSLRLRDERIVEPAIRLWPRVVQLHQPLCELLTVLAISPGLGRAIRHRLYELARRKGDVELLSIVVSVCQGEFGQLFPGLALKRLELVATQSMEPLEKPICVAYGQLWKYPRIRPLVVEQMAHWLTSDDIGLYTQAGQILAAATSITRRADNFIIVTLRCGPEYARKLAPGISRLLAREDVARTMRPIFANWFDATYSEPSLAMQLVDLFVVAVFSSGDINSAMRHITDIMYMWAPVLNVGESGDKAEFRDYLLRRLHEADLVVRYAPELHTVA